MGVDPSLRSTGIAYFGETTSWRHLRYKPNTPRSEILTKTMEYFSEAPSLGDWIVAIEGYSYGSNQSSGFTPTVEVGGTIRAAVGKWAPWIEVPPITWKYAIIGKACREIKKGTIEKNNRYIEVVCQSLGFDFPMFRSTDEADAYCIGVFVQRLVSGELKPSGAAKRISEQLKEAGGFHGRQ